MLERLEFSSMESQISILSYGIFMATSFSSMTGCVLVAVKCVVSPLDVRLSWRSRSSSIFSRIFAKKRMFGRGV